MGDRDRHHAATATGWTRTTASGHDLARVLRQQAAGGLLHGGDRLAATRCVLVFIEHHARRVQLAG